MSRSHRLCRVRPARRVGGIAFAAGLAMAMRAAAAAADATEAAAADAMPWLFITVAFVASAAAFFAWGRLLAAVRRPGAAPSPPSSPSSTLRTAAVAPPLPPANALTAENAVTAATATPPPPARAAVDAAGVVEAMPGVALLAARQPQGLAVQCLNAPARALWPHAGAGSLLETLAGLNAAARSTLDTLGPGQATSFDGWHMAMLPSTHSAAAASYLLSQSPGASAEGELFGSTLSHDLRAPIRVVEGFTRIVKEDYGRQLDRVGNDHLERVLGAASRMNLMIDALLTMARLSAQPLARQPVNLSQLAHFVADDLHRGSPTRQVEVDIEPGLAASGDPTLLRLVLENLLGNAWKYTARAEQARIALRGARHDGRHAFAVSDNGAGFDMRSAERLFGLFQRLHSANDFPGHGVGLASVRRIVQRHGGDIWAEGRPGHGATFTFTLG